MRALLLCVLVAGVVGAGLFACNPNSIGRPCVNPGGQVVGGTQVSSPALECPSRLCLLQPSNVAGDGTQGSDGGTFRATCTAECQSDGDCSPETTQYCKDGFKCAVATQAGPFCCKKLCICKTDLVPERQRRPRRRHDHPVLLRSEAESDSDLPERHQVARKASSTCSTTSPVMATTSKRQAASAHFFTCR